MDNVVAAAPYAEYRQLTVVDATGNCAFYSGPHTLGAHTVATGVDAVAAGNLLASEKVPQAMVEAFEADPHERPRRPAARRAAGRRGSRR